MSAQQTSYNLGLTAPSQPGMISDSDVTARVRAFRNDNASPISFGLAVSRSTDTDDRGFDALSVSRQFIGVLTWGQIKQNGTDGLPTKEMGGILEEGECYVKVVHTVTPDDPVRVFTVDYSGTTDNAVVGAFGTTRVNDKTALLLNAKYVSRASAGGVAKIRLNTPGPLLVVTETA